MWKKLLLSLWLAGMLWLGTLWMVNAESLANSVTYNDEIWFAGSTNDSQNKGSINTLWQDDDQQWWLIQVIKNFINWVLWIMALIVLVIVLVWWFQMVTASGNEEKYKKWFTILKHAGIWLVVIWLSWFVVTIIFWLLRWTTWNETGWGWASAWGWASTNW